MKDLALRYTYVDSPIGRLLLAGDTRGLHYLGFPSGRGSLAPPPTWTPDPSPFANVTAQLGDYFDGRLRVFDVALVMHGTEFQRRVWTLLRDIPFGETRSYGWLAAALGTPRASRAVGAANGANPLPIIVPCHRVIGADGSLTGFGGGLPTKRFLLELEGALAPADDEQLTLI
ncbi:MAG: methylated-DNA--[protein]-cysteine S-methyltransferase [Ectothiorhodospiraceae bacterium]|nr:methylated-DNA--[protein]-cysteine S-methyltransferase [Chromatiales bacterium]MCP5153601.1 methylated-DNA--[protein]-cysteine S-methyltransferase [Ectothiorhodospiraceae bacterium]